MEHIPVLFVLLAVGAADSPRFEVHSAHEKPTVGAIQEMDAGGTLKLADRNVVPVADLVSLRRVAEPLPPRPQTAQIILHNGDGLVGSPLELTGAMLLFSAASLRGTGEGKNYGALKIPLTTIAYLWLRAPETLERERYPSFFSDSRASDQIVLRNGDLISGSLTALNTRKHELQMVVDGDQRSIDLNKVIAVAFGTKLARVRKPTTAYERLVLSDGSRLTLTAAAIQDGRLSGTTMFRERIQTKVSQITALDFYLGKAVYLSDLKPSAFQYRSYLGEEHRWAGDKNLAGLPLQIKTPLGVETFDKGLAVHGECRIQYSLNAEFQRFECVTALDATSGIRGSVELRVLLDGKEQKFGDGKQLTMENGPVHLQLDVKGVKEITLIVNQGDGGNVEDYVNWCDARLIR